MKLIRWIIDNILFLSTVFLLIFIPLYPKFPLLDIKDTWVYIRLEDFFVLFTLLIWIILLFRKKVTINTPLTLPIILFWIIGAISTLHGVMIIFPTMSDMHPNIALLSYIRRIEYLAVFFVSYSSMNDKRFLNYIIAALVVTLVGVIIYGFGQKFFEFPAYLTMNEEFAKGIPMYLSRLSRIPSTFAGHYDLAAYLVLVLPILISLVFGFRNLFLKAFFILIVLFGFILLIMTVSRISFFAFLVSLFSMLIFYKKKWTIILLSFLLFIIFFSFSSTLLNRFKNTVKEVDVLISGTTGEVIGHVKEIPISYIANKEINVKIAQSKIDILSTIYTENEILLATSSSLITNSDNSIVALASEPNKSTGEDLPQGTSYINLPLSPIIKKLGIFYYEKQKLENATSSAIVKVYGHFLLKKVLAYDLSFTTRFQGEWPNAIKAFQKNILFGSGYSSVTLAVDNNYYRILGEVGILGFLSFFGIFIITAIHIKKILPDISSPIAKSFVLGFTAGVIGLLINATLIDVFEASKIAFILWILFGINLAVLNLYHKKNINISEEIKKIFVSPYSITVYLLLIIGVLFMPIIDYYFVGDDFTWFRWVADCNIGNNLSFCPSMIDRIYQYFSSANGFFYRPGTKVYFLITYSLFWLNQSIYHLISIALHFIVAVFIFIITRKVIKDYFFASISAILFLIMTGYSEAVFWISSTGFLFTAVFTLFGLIAFSWWKEKGKIIYFIFSIVSIFISMLFQEQGIIAPFFPIFYGLIFYEEISFKRIFKKLEYFILFLPIIPYLILRFFAQSHWLSGDYSYNFFKLPFNIVGNLIGYLSLSLIGPSSLFIYENLRNISKNYILFVLPILIFIIILIIILINLINKKLIISEKKILLFGSSIFIISLLPFLGLGNITSRYSYLSSVGFVILFAFLLKKIYYNLVTNDKYVATGVVSIIIAIFCLINIIQLQKIQDDWFSAGKMSQLFLVSLEKTYTTEPIYFYFVNRPIRHGNAWVFPVGINDALWLSSQKNYTGISFSNNSSDALDSASAMTNSRVFEFNNDGSVQWLIRELNGKIIKKDY